MDGNFSIENGTELIFPNFRNSLKEFDTIYPVDYIYICSEGFFFLAINLINVMVVASFIFFPSLRNKLPHHLAPTSGSSRPISRSGFTLSYLHSSRRELLFAHLSRDAEHLSGTACQCDRFSGDIAAPISFAGLSRSVLRAVPLSLQRMDYTDEIAQNNYYKILESSMKKRQRSMWISTSESSFTRILFKAKSLTVTGKYFHV